MDKVVAKWLKSKASPATLYELLGRPLLDPDLEGMLGLVRSSNRALWPYQDHADAAVAKRAQKLLEELGRAEDTLGNSGKLRAYQRDLLGKLFVEYSGSNGGPAPTWEAAPVMRWLSARGIHPEGLQNAVEAFRRLSGGTVGKPEPAEGLNGATGVQTGPAPAEVGTSGATSEPAQAEESKTYELAPESPRTSPPESLPIRLDPASPRKGEARTEVHETEKPPWVLWAAVGGAAAVILLIAVVVLVSTRKSGNAGPGEVARADSTPAAPKPAPSDEKPATSVPAADSVSKGAPSNAVEDLLKQATAAIEQGDFNQAKVLLEKYLDNDESLEQGRARTLISNLSLVTSDAQVEGFLKQLTDAELKDFAEDNDAPFLDRMDVPALRKAFALAVARNLAAERARRALAAASPPVPGPMAPAAAGLGTMLGARMPGIPGPGVPVSPPGAGTPPKFGSLPARPASKGAVTLRPINRSRPGRGRSPDPDPNALRLPIDEVAKSPSAYSDKLIMATDYVLVVPHADAVQGTEYGILPVLTKDSKRLSGTKLDKEDLNFLVDKDFARQLNDCLAQYRIRWSSKYPLKSVLTFTVKQINVENESYWAAVLVAMETLVHVEWTALLKGANDNAFTTINVSPSASSYDRGDGNVWIERLGGDKFMSQLRSRYRDMLRRQRTNIGQSQVDSAIRRGMGDVMRGKAASDSATNAALDQMMRGR